MASCQACIGRGLGSQVKTHRLKLEESESKPAGVQHDEVRGECSKAREGPNAAPMSRWIGGSGEVVGHTRHLG